MNYDEEFSHYIKVMTCRMDDFGTFLCALSIRGVKCDSR